MSAVSEQGDGRIAPVPTGRLYLLDGLRGVAAIAVILLHYYHFFQLWPSYQLVDNWRTLEPGWRYLSVGYVYGIFAVNVFWMISGFVFGHGYLDRKTSTREFVGHRFARLYPLHLLTLLVVAALQIASQALYGHMPIAGQNDFWHFLLNLLLISAWGMESARSFNVPIWSVSVEIAIYAVFWWSRHWLARSGLRGPAVFVVASGAFLLSGGHSLFAACAYYFFIGVALARLYRDRPTGSAWIIGALFGCGAIALSLDNAALALAIGLPSLFGGAMLLLAAAEPRASMRLRQICGAVGDNSYGLYLWHVPLQLLLILLLRPHFDIVALASNWWFLVAYLVGANLIAHVSFVHFERPARDWLRRRLAAPRAALELART